MEILNEVSFFSVLLGVIFTIGITTFVVYAVTVARNKESYGKPTHIQSICVEAWARIMMHPHKILNCKRHRGFTYTNWDLGYGNFTRNIKSNKFKKLTIGTVLFVPGTWGRTWVCVVVSVRTQDKTDYFRSVMVGEAQYVK